MSLVNFLADVVLAARTAIDNSLPSTIRTERLAKRWEREEKKQELGDTPEHAHLFGVKNRGVVHDQKNGQLYYKRDGNWTTGNEPWDTSSLSNMKLTPEEKNLHTSLFAKFLHRHGREIAHHKNQLGK